MTPEAQWLRAFVERRDADAFKQIAREYSDMVYSAALRQVREPHLAEDVTQAVFILLAAKASRIDPALLGGWLIKAARLTALQANRSRSRRQRHEWKAAAMKSEQGEPATPWDQIESLLDEALARLEDQDRTVLTLHYLNSKSIDDVAVAIGVGSEAARKRVARAVERIRQDFTRRGVDMPLSSLTAIVLERGKIAAPPHLAGRAALIVLSIDTATGDEVAQIIAKQAMAPSIAKVILICVAASVALLSIASWSIARRPQRAMTRESSIHPTPKPAAAIPPGAGSGEYYIDGLVKRSGAYTLGSRKITLKQAVIAAGGVDAGHENGVLEVLRRGTGDKDTVVIGPIPIDELMSGRFKDIFLQSNDVVRVGTRVYGPTTSPHIATPPSRRAAEK